MSDSATPQTAARQASLSFTTSRSLLKLMSVVLMTPSNHLIFCHSLLFLPSIFPSIRVISSESAFLIRWSKHWSFLISPSNEYLGLISFSIWTSLVPQTVKRLPTMQETWVPSLGREDALGKKMATHSSILAWKIPWTE